MPESIPGKIPTKYILALIAALIAAVVAVLWLNNTILISWDSGAYMAAAKTRQDFGALPSDYASFPPLYPLLLSLFPDIPLGAKILNVVSFALTAFLTMLVLEPDPLTAVFVGLLLVLSAPFQFVQTFALSEPIFIALVMLFFYGIKQQSVMILAAATGLACLERYVGIMLIPVGMFVVWRMPEKPRVSVILYLLGAALPIGIWILRNIVLGYGPFGIRHPGLTTWGLAVSSTLGTLVTWLPYLLIVAIIAVRLRLPVLREIGLVAGLYCLFHCAMVIYGAATTALDMPNQRLLAPIYIPFMLTAIAAFQMLLKSRGWLGWQRVPA